jgi:hypothetical protein
MRLKPSAHLAAAFALAMITGASAAAVELNPNHPQTYRVRSGDTLWGIAGRFLRDPWRWSEIWDVNPDVADPNLIYPGDVLQLRYRDGRPRIARAPGVRTVRLSPSPGTDRLSSPVAALPVSAIRPFITRPYVLEKEQIDAAPYVVGFPDRRVLGGTGDRLYVRSIAGHAGARYHIVRPGGPYRDPVSGDILGYEATYVAEAVLERPGDPASLRIAAMVLETTVGDRLLPASEAEPLHTYFPRPGPRGLRGRIISVLDGVSQIGLHNVVVLDLGGEQGVEAGHVFDVYNGGEQVKDRIRAGASGWDWKNMKFWSQEFWYGDYRADRWREDEPNPNEPFPLHAEASPQTEDYLLPYERAGTLMVFRSFGRVSFALVLRATRAMHLLDTVRPPGA